MYGNPFEAFRVLASNGQNIYSLMLHSYLKITILLLQQLCLVYFETRERSQFALFSRFIHAYRHTFRDHSTDGGVAKALYASHTLIHHHSMYIVYMYGVLDKVLSRVRWIDCNLAQACCIRYIGARVACVEMWKNLFIYLLLCNCIYGNPIQMQAFSKHVAQSVFTHMTLICPSHTLLM